jgi:type IV pilus assembly protein PilF
MLQQSANHLKLLPIRATGKAALLIIGVLLLAACVTETEHSVYTKEVTTDSAVKSHVDAAMEYLSAGDTENAIRHLKNAYERDPKSPVVHNGLALAFQMSGEKELAETHYKAALRVDRKMTMAHNNYGVFLYSEGRYPEACKQMRLVIKDTLYDGRANAFQNLGRCELKLGNVEAAEEAFERAVAINRMHAPAMLELADINMLQGEYVKAQDYYKAYKVMAEQNARSLYIGIQLADYFDEEDKRASYALALKNMYPHSEEYIRYKNEKQ